jgi:hypothetical protein
MWDSFWAGWDHWWPTIDWGNAPAWVGSILTSVSVFLAIRLFIGERFKRERAQADMFSVYLEKKYRKHRNKKVYESILVHMYNGSDAPIPRATLYIRTRVNSAVASVVLQKASSQSLDRSVPSKLHFEQHVDLIGEPPFPPNARIYIHMRDINGRVWRKNMKTGRTKKLSEKYVLARSFLV